jgi:chromatin remodeling complex protein RSC6
MEGFYLPKYISIELCKFFGVDVGTRMARTECTKKIVQYIKDNNLEDTTNRRNINPDAKLEAVIGNSAERIDTFKKNAEKKGKPTDGIDATVTYVNIQILLTKHFF